MSRGLEIKLNNEFKLKNFEIISQSTFCNTVSQIQKSNINNDNSIGKQLSYVPKLKVSNLIHLKSKKLMTSLLTSYNGKVYTTSDETRSLPRYFLLDILFHYTFYDPLNITFKINNLTNKSYQVYEWYPMPGRNYSLILIINFNHENNKNNSKLIVLFITFTILSCTKDNPEPLIPEKYDDGIFITCEGRFTSANGSLSFISDNGVVENNIFNSANGFPLGDVVQSITIIDTIAYIVVNNSGKVVVADAGTMEYISEIPVTTPDHMTAISNEVAYVSDWNALLDNGLYM